MSLVPFDARKSAVDLLASRCSLQVADARVFERAVYCAATDTQACLRTQDDPLCILSSAAEVANAATAAYCAILRRATKFRRALLKKQPVNTMSVSVSELARMTETTASVEAAKYLGWGGHCAAVAHRAAAALAELTADRSDVRESIYSCGFCGSRNVTHLSKQVRSGDEGATVFISCAACGLQSKLNT